MLNISSTMLTVAAILSAGVVAFAQDTRPADELRQADETRPAAVTPAVEQAPPAAVTPAVEQTPPAAVTPAVEQTPPAAVTPAVEATRPADETRAGQDTRPAEDRQADEVRRRRQTVMMEVAFSQAVRNGAAGLVTQIQGFSQISRVSPMMVMSGEPEARGVWLPGYGVHFSVHVPGMRPTFALNFPDLVAAQLRARAAQIQSVRATSIGTTTSVPAPPPPVSPLDAGVLSDPEVEYTRQVKTAIMDAMLENSFGLRIAPDEMLSVSARDDTPADPLVPTDQTDARTVVFQIKGSDLAVYREGRITLEEARSRIVVTED